MGLADIAVATLESETTRNSIGNNGVRKFNTNLTSPDKDDDGGILGWIWNGGKQLVGWLLSEAGKFLSFSLTTLWGWVTSTLQYLWNFNWNISDSEIDNQIKQKWAALSGMLGGALGNFIGYLGCGVVPGATMFAFNEPLGAYVLANVAEEMADEFLANLGAICRYTLQVATQSLILWSFKNTRKFLKANPAILTTFFGDDAAKLLQSWGATGSKPWSFAIATESAIKSIGNDVVENFVEELLEEAWEGCVEAGYVVANSTDSYLAAEKLKQKHIPVLGKDKYVEIKPDRSIDNQRIVLAGPEQVLKSGIVNTLTNYQLMQDKDIGAFVGAPIDDYLRTRPQTVRILIQFFNTPQPPWSRGTTRRVSATYAIPDINPAKIEWEELKLACGGANGYLWGRFRATIILDTGRQIQAWGATKDEAGDRATAFLKFTKGNPARAKPTITEDQTEDTTGSFVKQPTRIYPAYFTIMNQYQIPGAGGSGIPINGKRYIRKKDRIDLWVPTKPADFEEVILDLLKKPGAEQT